MIRTPDHIRKDDTVTAEELYANLEEAVSQVYGASADVEILSHRKWEPLPDDMKREVREQLESLENRCRILDAARHQLKSRLEA